MGAILLGSAAGRAGPGAQGPAAEAGSAAQPAAPLITTGAGLVYDRDYPFIGYSGTPQHNDIARLEARMQSGKVKLEYREPRGYLDSLLKALDIDPASQAIVFSKTSLQADIISPHTPRAIYFNDDTYVAWIEHTSLIEIATMDSMMGTVFYMMAERPGEPAGFERETTRCLSCHDTYSLSGGGVPNFLFLSAYTRDHHEIVTNTVAMPTTDSTPLPDRWGGWYVTGQLGGLEHLGNILPSPNGHAPLSAMRSPDLVSLDGLIDPDAYLTDTSDAVAVLVLEHQVYMHNLIIRANYKSRMLMERQQPGSSTATLTWKQLPPPVQRQLTSLLEPMVRAMLFVDAARIAIPVQGTAGFARTFQARGPRDPQGRSLRDLDLHSRLFKYPLSFLIYSEGFDYLPAVAKERLYKRLGDILTGRDTSPTFSRLSASDRLAILEILRATKPDFTRSLWLNATASSASFSSTKR
jgi:hypothetical protein